MTLVSPGVSISVINESFYSPAGTGTVPLIVIATAQNKPSPDGAGIAQFTTAAEAGKVKLMTSQRDLITNYGNPIFKTLGNTPLHGHELNEYGLAAAFSFMGIANRAYVLRADIDLNSLESSAQEPYATPANGAYWFDTGTTVWGLKRWNGSAWVRQTVRVAGANNVDSGDVPKAAFGVDNEYAVVYTDSNGNTLEKIKMYQKVSGTWYHIGSAGWLTATGGDYQIARHTALPVTRSNGNNLISGDVLLQTNAPNNGSQIVVRVFNASTGQFVSETIEGWEHSYQAYAAYMIQGGVTAGDLWAQFSSQNATVKVKRHSGANSLTAASSVPLSDTEVATSGHSNTTVSIRVVVDDRDAVNGNAGIIDVIFGDFDADTDGFFSVDEMVTAFQAALSAANPLVTYSDRISVSNVSGRLTVVSSTGVDVKFLPGDVGGFTPDDLNLQAITPYSNWEALSYEASSTEIEGELANGTLWYDSLVSSSRIDILYNDQGTWESYPFDVNVAASAPVVQSNGSSALVAGDLWVSSADLENYPRIYKWTGTAWAEIDTADQESSDGIIFADFRVASNLPLSDDAPQSSLYPFGILAWNKRASGGNIKQWDAVNQRWNDYSGNRGNGSPYMLRRAQRRAVVRQLQAAINSNTDIRNENNRFNLIACPGYPELLDEMVALNVDRKETAFIVADAPLRLTPDATSVQRWATNGANASENGEDGLLTRYDYAAVYYPHGLTSNLDGNNIFVPASHIALRTIAFSDQVSFPWFAPAGFQRGVVTNASSVGYLNSSSEYVGVSLSEGQRDVLYLNNINPISSFPGRGLSVFGQKTLSPTASALDRVNVARLIVYLREQLDDLVKPFLFQPNDEITRQNAKVTVDRFLGNIAAQRGLFDFLTVCDTSNNTPDRIDRNELWIDIAVQPAKAIEFIYIPIRVQNTLGSTN